MKGKRVAEGRKSGCFWYDDEKAFMEAGLLDSIKFTYGGFGSGAHALADGLVDVTIALAVAPVDPTTCAPDAPLQQLIASKDVYFVSHDKEALDRAAARFGLWVWPVTVPAKTISPLQTQPLVTKYDASILAADKELDEKIVYEVVRILHTYADKLSEFHATGKWITRETLGISDSHPLEEYHPGAMKYFKEHGIKMRVHP
jgi:TRAP-type uncharacterized transport system substrate-binding protein